MTDHRTGQCMCGAVRYRVRGVHSKITACHCGMCRRWSGGPLFAVTVDELTFDTEDALGVIASSAWAERGFCRECGSGLFYRITAEGRFQGITSVAMGTLDDQSGLTLVKEWFIDKRPEAYALAGEHEGVTEAQALAMFGGG